MTRNGTETRQGQDRETGLGRNDDGPVVAISDDAPNLGFGEQERLREALEQIRQSPPANFSDQSQSAEDLIRAVEIANAALSRDAEIELLKDLKWNEDDSDDLKLIRNLEAMYSHRGDGIPTQFVNPDGHAAAKRLRALLDTIEQLSATIEAMRGLLPLVEKCAPMFPITTGQSCPDYADVHFGTEAHSSQVMTMNPEHWEALNELFDKLSALLAHTQGDNNGTK